MPLLSPANIREVLNMLVLDNLVLVRSASVSKISLGGRVVRQTTTYFPNDKNFIYA